MKILIHIQADNELSCHEAFSMAFALASFEHDIQLWLEEGCLNIIEQCSPKLGKMLSSLDMYDMPKAWVTSELLTQRQQALLTDNQSGQDMQDVPNWLSQLTASPTQGSSQDFSQDFDLTLHL